jgi:segregation and condensation protein B
MEMVELLEVEGELGNGYGYDHGAAVAAQPTPEEGLGRLPAVLESLLLAAGAPVPIARLVDALDGPGRAEVRRALELLRAHHERSGSGIRVVEVGGGWQLRTPAEHAPWVRRLLRERPPRLSRPMLETLAIVAYRQPCTRLEIEAIRGVDCDAVLTTLTERRLVRVVGRKEAPGRPLLYGTTREFLEVFGLPDLSALPTLRELGVPEEVLRAAAAGGEGEAAAGEAAAAEAAPNVAAPDDAAGEEGGD